MSAVESKGAFYRRQLLQLAEWDEFLLAESGLPGPRGNLELMAAVAALGDEARFRRYLQWDAQRAPTNDPREFLAACGTVGLGHILQPGRDDLLALLRASANDARWRLREAAAMALQALAARDMPLTLEIAAGWAQGNLLEQRAAAAALCEPALLRDPETARRTLDMLDRITVSFVSCGQRKSEAFRVLSKGLSYCWSVAVAALPEEGRLRFEHWLDTPDADVRRVLRENLKKNRLARMDAAWVAACQARLA